MSNTMNRLNEQGITGLVDCARRGDFTMPDDVMDVFAALERAASVKSPKEDELERLAGDMYRALGGRGTELIEQHIKPALDEVMSSYAADVATLGTYATEPVPPVNLLTEPDEMRQAYIRIHSAQPRYWSIRTGWELLRRGYPETTDPRGTASPLAEIRNLPDLVSNWERCAAGQESWPWGWATGGHVRLSWIVANGGEVWCPTAAEQSENWTRYAPVKAQAQRYAW